MIGSTETSEHVRLVPGSKLTLIPLLFDLALLEGLMATVAPKGEGDVGLHPRPVELPDHQAAKSLEGIHLNARANS